MMMNMVSASRLQPALADPYGYPGLVIVGKAGSIYLAVFLVALSVFLCATCLNAQEVQEEVQELQEGFPPAAEAQLGDIETAVEQLLNSYPTQILPETKPAADRSRTGLYSRFLDSLDQLESRLKLCAQYPSANCGTGEIYLVQMQAVALRAAVPSRSSSYSEQDQAEINAIYNHAVNFSCEKTLSGGAMAGNLASEIISSILTLNSVRLFLSPFRAASGSYAYDPDCINNYSQRLLEFLPEDILADYRNRPRSSSRDRELSDYLQRYLPPLR